MHIQKLASTDLDRFTQLIRLFEDVFEMEDFRSPPEAHLQQVLENRDFHAFVALDEHAVIGGLTVYTLHQYYSKRPLAYIYDLAVERDRQRLGIGRQLIDFVTTYFKDKGYEEVFVQADKDEPHALNFYRGTAPTEEEDVSHFYYRLST